jgi:hypothetical protein
VQCSELIVIVAILGLILTVAALTTLCSQNAFAQNSNVGNAGQGRAGGGSSGAYGGIDRDLFCNTGVITPICISSNIPLINHLSVTSHPTINVPKQDSIISPNNAAVAHVSSKSSNLLHPRPLINHLATMHSIGDSSASSRHHYHNISHHLHHGKTSGYAGRYDEGPGGSFGGGPGGSFGEGEYP